MTKAVSSPPPAPASLAPGRLPPPAFLAGNSEMAERARAMDWSSSPVGEPATWPQSLKTAVSICIGSRYPIVVWWGHPEYTMFYNDGYVPILGVTKHPGWLGRSGRECWSEIWPIVGPMLDSVFATGEATWSEDLLLVMDRNIPREENYFTFSYSPIHDDGDKVGGIFCACYETTGRVIGERRLRTLRDLNRLGAEMRTAEAACTAAARTIGENPFDVPFSLIYLLEEDGGHAQLVAATSLEPGSKAAPHRIALHDQTDATATWPLWRVLAAAKSELIPDLAARFGPLPGGPWPESAEAALIVPIAAPGQTKPAGFLVAGLSPRRVIDADYRSYLDLIAGHIGASVANARAYEEERKRAEALADIDRAKTAFFSNVSHEFRTPLTLMMGPLEDMLAQSGGLAAADRERIELAHRNSLRLLKLVNALLDFSRIESGRIQASYEPTEMAAFTAELASVFRSAIERAGLKLIIDCPPLAEPVFLDREMWEKIVLNLLSNAFKFTLAGEIAVQVETDGREARLTVRDTGTGIPVDEIPRLFERFHRIKGAQGRSYEGSGIGLSLVQELVKLHGGSVRVESEVGRGSRFIVSLPLGRAHLSADRITAPRTLASTGLQSDAFVEEALRWLPDAGRREAAVPFLSGEVPAGFSADAGNPSAPPGTRPAQSILLADDNADMREYVCRLLRQSGYEVETAGDGLAALAAARARPPSLVLTDVMMPALDGFGLLRELRRDPALAAVPVILLSARAGEEAQIEGMQAGADDYLIKPFSARELLARVEAHVKMARFRRETEAALRESEARFRAIVETTPECVKLVAPDGMLLHMNSAGLAMVGVDSTDQVVGKSIYEVIAAEDRKKFQEFNEQVCAGEKGMLEFDIVGLQGERRQMETHGAPLQNPDGTVVHLAVTRDVSARKKAEAALRAGEKSLQQVNAALSERVADLQQAAVEIRDSRRAAMNLMQDAMQARGQVEKLNLDLRTEITEREKAHQAMHQRTAQFETLLNQAPIGVYVVDADFRIREVNPAARPVFGDITNILGRDYDEVIHLLWPRQFADELVRLFRHTLETGEPYLNTESSEHRVDRDATEFYEWRIDRIPLPDGRFGVVCYFRDISAQVRARLTITDSEERHRSLISVITDVPWTTDASGAFVTPQPSWQAYTGQKWEEHRGFGWLASIHPDDRERIKAEWNKALLMGTRYATQSRLWNAGTGEYRHYEVQATPLLNADGSVREWVGACTDTENRIRAELQIKVARDEALAANRAKDEFLARLSHELRTPLNPVLLVASESAEDRVLPERVRDDFKMIADNISLQARLIDDLLDYSRIVHGKMTIERRTVDLHVAIRDAAAMIQEDVAAKKLNLTFSLNAPSPMMDGDPVRLRQVFWNVLKNAVKFTPAEGRITVETATPSDGGELVVRITDTGIGMTPSELAHIFQAFSQGDHATPGGSHRFGGLGLGLAISNMMMKLHSGSIAATSAGRNQGTTVTIKLPLLPGAAPASAPVSRRSPVVVKHPPLNGKNPRRVLLVEDHVPTAQALKYLLVHRNYDVIAAACMAEARVVAGREKFDVLISDIGLPDGNGYELMAELRNRQNLVGIALTGYGMEEDVNRSRTAGFTTHLTKPVSVQALDQALSAIEGQPRKDGSP